MTRARHIDSVETAIKLYLKQDPTEQKFIIELDRVWHLCNDKITDKSTIIKILQRCLVNGRDYVIEHQLTERIGVYNILYVLTGIGFKKLHMFSHGYITS